MNLKLYGICFKMRGGPDLLDYVQTGSPVPVSIMEQVVSQMGSITQEEMGFAEKLDKDWKKAFNERVPLLVNVMPDGGYDITCTVPDELLQTIQLLYDMESEKIVEEYAADYLKTVCGIEASILSVDVEEDEDVKVKAEQAPQAQGFDLSDLDAEAEEPAFEGVSYYMGMEETEMPVEMPMEDAEPEEIPVEDLETEEEISMEEEAPEEEAAYEGEGLPLEEGYPEEGEFPYEEEEPGTEEGEGPAGKMEEGEPAEADERETYRDAVKDIYTQFVGNIKERRLDERLGLRIGQ